MTDDQIKAGKKLKAALRSCAKAGLVVHAYTDVGFYVVPLTALEEDVHFSCDTDTQNFHEKHGMNCDPTKCGLLWDAGAGV